MMILVPIAATKIVPFFCCQVLPKENDEVWAVGGSNTMFVLKDNGKNFTFDKSANNIPGNLYNFICFRGYTNASWALGSNGLLLQYVGENA
jgi:photosystem II stability/assembly factor-like uncharacterized protein